jgi:hypothetical protein
LDRRVSVSDARAVTISTAGGEKNLGADHPGDAVPIYESNPQPPATGGELFWSAAGWTVIQL